MRRIFILVGTWASVVVVAGACLAAEPKKAGNQPAAPASPSPPPARQPAAPPSTPTKGSGGSLRYVAPPTSGGIDTNRRAADARHAAQAAAAQQAAAAAAAKNSAAAAAAATAAASARQNNRNHRLDGNYRNSPYGYGNDNYYSPYGYSPYGYSNSPYGYVPPGATPYVLGYNPSTGASFLAPYSDGYSPYYPQQYGYQYPYYRNPYLGYGYPAAVFAPAGQLYGLGPIQQLMGVDRWSQQPQAPANGLANGNPNLFANGNANANPGFANNKNAGPNAARHDADPPLRKPAAPAGGKALEIAWKFITYGDAHFGNQKFNNALDRYRRAVRECPGLSDAWFRQGFALAALGRYEQAAKAMRRGLEEKPDWVDNNFRLAELYGDDPAEKKSLLDKMVKTAEEEPTNADLAYVVGVHLYCDGRPDQAAPFFRRAAQIRGTDAEVKPFLAK